MNHSSLLIDEDQDSLFGSPPPSPGRGRSPSQAPVAGEEVGPIAVVPSAGVGRKNVGTIALPGSHMSCAELPADLPATSSSPPRSTSSSDSPPITPPTGIATSTSIQTPLAASRSARPIPSRGSSAAASTKKRRTPKAKSLTPVPPAPPITLPGPYEPTPPNFLRSQSSLLGLAGVVGCVKPTRLHTHTPQPTPVQQSRSRSPARGSTPSHPIVVDDDQHTPQIGKGSRGQLEMPPNLDQLNPEILRSNILCSLTKEKNIFPVLESLVKILGGEPRVPSRNPLPQPFARPYGHGIFNVQSANVTPPYPCGGLPTTAIRPPKRRKLKHVPAGAADWDVPFPFAAGEGPEAYRDTWAQDRAKRLVVQLLELVRDATKRAAIKTVKSGGQAKAQSCRPSRSTSVETQIGQVSSTGTNVPESVSHASITPNSPATETPSGTMSMDTLYDFLNSWESPMDSEGAAEAVDPVTVGDHLGFEEWLSQLQNLLPPETNTPTPEPSEQGTQLLAPLDFSGSGLAPGVPVPAQHNTSIVAPQPIQDQAIDPTLLAISQQAASPSQAQFAPPTSTPQVLEISTIVPVLSHTPRTSFSSVTGPPTPTSDASVDGLANTTHDALVDGHPTCESLNHSANGAPAGPSTEPLEPLQKGKARADVDVISATPSRPPSVVTITSKGTLDKRAILERARARREQLVAEIQRAKHEIWETSVEGAVLVHLTRDRPS